MEIINLIFTAIFALEAFLKIIALGFSNYIKNNWNKFDFFVVVSSLIDIILSFTDSDGGNMLRIGP